MGDLSIRHGVILPRRTATQPSTRGLPIMVVVLLLTASFLSAFGFCCATCMCCRTLRGDCRPFREAIKCKVWIPAVATCVITTVAYHALMVPYYNKLEAHERKEVGLGTIGLIGDGVGTFVGVLFFCCCLVTFSPRRVDQLSLERAQQAQKEAVAWAEAQQGADFIQISIAPTIAERELQVTVSKNHYVSHLIAQLPYQQSTTSWLTHSWIQMHSWIS